MNVTIILDKPTIVVIIRPKRMAVGNKYQNVQQVASANNVHHFWWKREYEKNKRINYSGSSKSSKNALYRVKIIMHKHHTEKYYFCSFYSYFTIIPLTVHLIKQIIKEKNERID